MAGFAPRGRTELRRLLDVAELDHAVPSTLWHRTGEGTWRTGIHGDQPAWQAAAHEAGSVTAWRSFTSEDDHTLELQVVPLAGEDDAPAALAAVSDPTVRLRRGSDLVDPQVEATTAGGHLVVALTSGAGWDTGDLPAILAAQVARLN